MRPAQSLTHTNEECAARRLSSTSPVEACVKRSDLGHNPSPAQLCAPQMRETAENAPRGNPRISAARRRLMLKRALKAALNPPLNPSLNPSLSGVVSWA